MPKTLPLDLTTERGVFARAILNGVSVNEACATAGLTESQGYTFLRSSSFLEELHSAIKVDLKSQLLPLAVSVAREIMSNKNAPAGVRATLAIQIMDRAGLAPPKGDAPAHRDPTVMSPGELHREIQRLERELSDRAKPVILPDAPPAPPQVSDLLE